MTIQSRIRLLIVPVVLLWTLLLGAAPASAQTLLTDHVTDQAGVLGSGLGQVETAVKNLAIQANVDLWVVFIDSGNGTSAQDLARQTFESNGFGGNDMVLLVAVQDHRYGWWETTATGLSTDQINTIAGDNLDPSFRRGDYAGGVVNFAGALGNAVRGGKQPIPVTTVPPVGPIGPTAIPVGPTSSGSGGGGGWGGLLVFLGVVLAFVVVLLVAIRIRLWWLARQSAEERDRRLRALARQANQLLVGTDDAITNARQELSFAQAEFSDADCAPFSQAIDKAQDQLQQAFTLRHQLDDSTPEDPATRQQMYQQIILLCGTASTQISEQHARIQALRDLEKNAPAALASLDQAIDALKARETAIKTSQQTLAGYPPSSWAAIKGNAEEADKRGAFAEAQIEKGKAALAKPVPDNAAAASAARQAQDAVAQANQLLDAIEAQARALDDARARLQPELAAAAADVQAAKSAASGAAAGGGAADPQLAGQLAQAEQQLASAQAAAVTASFDPIATLKAAQTAHAAADSVLAGQRAAREQVVRNQAAFNSARAMAAASVAQATGYLSARTSGVGASARAKLAEAQGHLAQADAIVATDVPGATIEAQRAENLANSAYNMAVQDFATYDTGSRYGRPGGGAGANVGAAILGGIIGGMISGGRGGGWGGSHWGSGGGGWGGGGFGGFGGGGHGGGGGFGGGGGHGGGGGW
jgi:uncharacterized membrane protein YgcG